MLAAKLAGDDDLSVLIADDRRKPDIAVQMAEKWIESDKVETVTGFRRPPTGALARGPFTTLEQVDFTAEISWSRAGGTDNVVFPRVIGSPASGNMQIAASACPAFSFDQAVLRAVGAATLGVRNSPQWNSDLDNAAKAKFVVAFQT